MIPRYLDARDDRRSGPTSPSSQRWLEVELLATEAHAAIGVVPAADAAACRGRRARRRRALRGSGRSNAKRSPITTWPPSSTSCRQAIGDAGKWIHYGLTSSDVGDTALCWQMRDAADVLSSRNGAARDARRTGSRSTATR